MTGKQKQILIPTLLLVLAIVISLLAGALAGITPAYNYVLSCTQLTDTKLVLSLIVLPAEFSDPLLYAGHFGLRFPDWMGEDYSFTPSSLIEISQMVPPERYQAGGEIFGEGYHAFMWTVKPNVKSWDMLGTATGVVIGTYEFNISAGHAFSMDSIGQLDWFDALESEPVESRDDQPEPGPGEDDWPPPTREDDDYNATIWNPETSRYQGYYEKDGQKQVDINFTFALPNALAVLSYDPKKPMTVELRNEENELVADGFTIPLWIGGQTAHDTINMRALREEKEGTGTGAYVILVGIDKLTLAGKAAKLTAETSYTLVISKPGHLTVKLDITTGATADLLTADGVPSINKPVYLPCGDINPVIGDEATTYGDGRITISDRSVLLAYINRQVPVPAKDEILGASVDYGAYLADLDGDGYISIADLNILMSPENYNKRAQ